MEEVYPPAEDSWLLEECILKENLFGKRCLDLGCGSGIQSIAMLKSGASEVLAADVNADALKAAQNNVNDFLIRAKKEMTQYVGPSKTQRGFTGPGEEYFAGPVEQAQLGPAKPKVLLGHSFGIQRSDLFSGIKGNFDFIAFNPPYVPTVEVKWGDLDGGKKGREVIDRFVKEAKQHLNPGGVVLLLASSLNNTKELTSLLAQNRLSAEIVKKKKLFFEEIAIIRARLL